MTVSAIPVSPTVALPSAGVTSSPAVARAADGVLPSDAVTLAGDADVVSLLGGGNGAGATYNASGLFNSIAQAGQAASATSATASPSLGQDLANNLTQPASSSSLNALSTAGQASALDLTSNYASILKATPSAAAGVIADSFNQGIVSTISVYA